MYRKSIFPAQRARKFPNDQMIDGGCCKKDVPIQPSAAATEKIFSLLKNTFGDQLQTSLSDYVDASLIRHGAIQQEIMCIIILFLNECL